MSLSSSSCWHLTLVLVPLCTISLLWCGPRTLLTHLLKHTSNLSPRLWLWRELTLRSDNMTSFLLWPKLLQSCSLARLQTGESGCLTIELFPSPFGTSVQINATAVWLLRHSRWQLKCSHTPGASVSTEVPMTPTCFLAPNLSTEPDLINVMIKAGKASFALR